MAYKLAQQVARATTPTANDDADAGFVVGSLWINTAVTPRAAYVCTESTVGNAGWELVGTLTSHPAYPDLQWAICGHDGTTTSVAGFTGAGAAQTIQASADGQVLQRINGNLVFASFGGTITFGPSVESGYIATYAPNATTVTSAGGAAYYPIGTL